VKGYRRNTDELWDDLLFFEKENYAIGTPGAVNRLRGGRGSDHYPGCWKYPGHPDYGMLSPDWVEYLMGWPIGHTDIERDTVEFIPWSDGDPADTGHTPRTGNGIKHRAARLKAIGNGQVPQAMVLAWQILSEED